MTEFKVGDLVQVKGKHIFGKVVKNYHKSETTEINIISIKLNKIRILDADYIVPKIQNTCNLKKVTKKEMIAWLI